MIANKNYQFSIYNQNGMNSEGSDIQTINYQPNQNSQYNTLTGSNYSTVSGGVFSTGLASYTTYTYGASGQYFDDIGFAYPYSWTQTFGGYVPQIISTQGNTITTANCNFGSCSSYYSGFTAPHYAGDYTGTYITITVGTPLSIAQYLYMKLVLIN